MQKNTKMALVAAIPALFIGCCCCWGINQNGDREGQPTPSPRSTISATPTAKIVTESPAENVPVHYSSCAAAKRAGAKLPLRRGDAGYSRELDRDGDGVACEN